MNCATCPVSAGDCLGAIVPRLCVLAATRPEYAAELVRGAALDPMAEAVAEWWADSLALYEADNALREGRPVKKAAAPCCGEKKQAAPRESEAVAAPAPPDRGPRPAREVRRRDPAARPPRRRGRR